MKVAIVHEYVLKLGGAERVLSSLLDMYPEADVFTLVYNKKLVEQNFPGINFVDSNIQKAGWFKKKFFRLFLGGLSREVEYFDLSGYDLVISSSNSFAHGVVTSTDSLHVAYYHSPARFLWDWKNEYLIEKGWKGWKKFMVDWIRKPVREWDFLAAQRPDVVLANSKHVQKRIQKYYRREAEIVYPPVDIERIEAVEGVEDYYLIVSTLARYKRIDLAVEAFKKNGVNLKIVGSGSDMKFLKEIADGASNIEFLGFVSDQKVGELMSRCRALVFCSEEDFGITPVEAMAAGRPVLGYGKGGLLETVIDGKTGLFFAEQTVGNFINKLEKFEEWVEKDFKPEDSVKRSKEFSEELFKEKFSSVVNREKKNQVNI